MVANLRASAARYYGLFGLADLIALACFTRSLWVWGYWQGQSRPDFALYTHGGWRLYPSPLGTLLGLLGENEFAMIAALSAATIVVIVYEMTGSITACFVVCLWPPGYYLMYAGVDPISSLLFISAIHYRSRILMVISSAMHLAVLPFALVWLRVRPIYVVILLAMGMVILLDTPYRGIVFHVTDSSPEIAGWTAANFAVMFIPVAPLLYFCIKRRFITIMFLVSALEGGVQLHLQERYAIPAFLVLVGYFRPIMMDKPSE